MSDYTRVTVQGSLNRADLVLGQAGIHAAGSLAGVETQ